MNKWIIIFICIFLPSIAFSEENLYNSIIISGGIPHVKEKEDYPKIYFGELTYERLFLNNHLGLSSGAGVNYEIEKSVFIPVRVKYIPFNTFIKPDLYCGGIFAYNRYNDDFENDSKPVFDKGFDTCFEMGFGLTVSPVLSSVTLGGRFHVFTDFQGAADMTFSIEAGYMF